MKDRQMNGWAGVSGYTGVPLLVMPPLEHYS